MCWVTTACDLNLENGKSDRLLTAHSTHSGQKMGEQYQCAVPSGAYSTEISTRLLMSQIYREWDEPHLGVQSLHSD